MKNIPVLIILIASVAVSGCIGIFDTDPGTDRQLNHLDNIVLNNSELPDGFRLTQDTRASEEDFKNSTIKWRVHRRFVSKDNSIVILSSATIYESNRSARQARANFLKRTPGEAFTSNIAGVNTSLIFSNISPETKVVYNYHRGGREIYFVGVKNNTYAEDLSFNLYQKMVRDAEN